MELKKYERDPKTYQRLLDYLESVDDDFDPPISSYGPLDKALSHMLDNGTMLYLEEGGKIAGCFAYYLDSEEYDGSYIKVVTVSPEFQGRGYGKLLLQRCLDDLRSRGSQRVFVTTSSTMKRAIKYYESLGFSIVKKDIDARGPGVHRCLLMAEL